MSVARADPIEDCDRLAAEVGEGGAGVALDAIDPATALPACAAAIVADPQAPRLKHQYARALERAGDRAEAVRLYQWAADDGYAPAAAALVRLAIAPDTPETPADLDAEARGLADIYDGLAASLRTYVGTLPPDPRERVGIIAEIGTDPDAILAWVASNTRLIPYRGLLRDAEGVLLDRSGNSLDRALLLARLLGDAGFEVRLARAPLSGEQARALLSAPQPVVNPARLPPPDRASRINMLASDPRVPRADVEQLIDQRLADETRADGERQRLLARVGDAVTTALAPREAAMTAALTESALQAVSDHWWVQLRTASGWRDLDPQGAVIGALAATETMALDSVPGELRHVVVLRVIAEVTKAEGREEVVLLSEEVKPTEGFSTQIQLKHRTLSMRPTRDYIAEASATTGIAAMRDAALNERAWLPVLTIGAKEYVDRFFTAAGETPVASGRNLAERGLGTGFVSLLASLDKALGTVFTEPAEGQGKSVPKAALTAEWIEVEIRTPGSAPIIHRRQVFDAIGPAARAAGSVTVTLSPEAIRGRAEALLGSHHIAVFGSQPSNILLERAILPKVADLSDFVATTLRLGDPVKTLDANHRPEAFTPAFALAYGLSRGDGAPARPNVVMVHERLRFAEDNVAFQTLFDIVDNTVAGPGRPSAKSLVLQGVEDTIAETLVLRDDDRSINTALTHDADIGVGRAWRLIEADSPALNGLLPDVRARIAAQLSMGRVAVVRVGADERAETWWLIDPSTGATLGIGLDGYGAALAEHSYHVSKLDKMACGFFMIGAIIASGSEHASASAITGALCFAGPVVGGASKVAGAAMGVVGIAIDALEIVGHFAGGHGGGEH